MNARLLCYDAKKISKLIKKRKRNKKFEKQNGVSAGLLRTRLRINTIISNKSI